MTKSVTYIGKHSKDKALSIYLPRRVYIDGGEGMEQLHGIVRLDPEVGRELPSGRVLVVGVLCKFIYECFDFEIDVVDHTLYETTLQLLPRGVQDPASCAPLPGVILPDEWHFPFNFILPKGLPPSVTLHPGYVYMGRPIGISYEVYACIADAADLKSKRASRAALRFRKASYYPPCKVISSVSRETAKRFLLSGSHHPLILRVTLDREIYYAGEPIPVHVEVINETKHSVYAIRLSSKQIVMARVHSGEKDKYKCIVAQSTTTENCPVKRGQSLKHTFSMIPQILDNESYRVAQAGRIHLNEPAMLAPTTREDETPKDRKGLSVAYYIKIHACVSFSRDIVVKIPFILSGAERRSEHDPDESHVSTVHVTPAPELVEELSNMGFERELSEKALRRSRNDIHTAVDWLDQHQDRKKSEEHLLINFEDAEIDSHEEDDHIEKTD